MKKIKLQYNSFKNLLTILESGDIHDPRYKLLIESLRVDQVEEMRAFVKFYEDQGIKLVRGIN